MYSFPCTGLDRPQVIQKFKSLRTSRQLAQKGGKVPLGRPKNRWKEDVKTDVTGMKITNLKDCIRNLIKWKKFVEKAKTSLKL
jgi:hypothetical protein